MNEAQTLINLIVDARDAKWQGMLQQAVADTSTRIRQHLPPEDERRAVDKIVDLIKENMFIISDELRKKDYGGVNAGGLTPPLIDFLAQLHNDFGIFQRLQDGVEIQEEDTDPMLFPQQPE